MDLVNRKKKPGWVQVGHMELLRDRIDGFLPVHQLDRHLMITMMANTNIVQYFVCIFLVQISQSVYLWYLTCFLLV